MNPEGNVIKSFSDEPVSKRFSLFKVEEGEIFNYRNTLLFRGLKFESDLSAPACALHLSACGHAQAGVEIGQISADFEMGRFEIGSDVIKR